MYCASAASAGTPGRRRSAGSGAVRDSGPRRVRALRALASGVLGLVPGLPQIGPLVGGRVQALLLLLLGGGLLPIAQVLLAVGEGVAVLLQLVAARLQAVLLLLQPVGRPIDGLLLLQLADRQLQRGDLRRGWTRPRPAAGPDVAALTLEDDGARPSCRAARWRSPGRSRPG